MKLNIDIKNKKGSLDSDVEKLVEKGMDLHDKNWKEKFETKHYAKKEIMELQHKQKMEEQEQSKNKKNFIERIIEENRKTKQLELEDRRIREEAERIEKQKKFKVKLLISIVLGITSILLFTIGSILGSKSGDPNSGWHAMACIGLFPGISIPFVWTLGDNSKK